MEVTEALENARGDLANTLTALQEARELVSMHEADVKKLQIEIVGLQSFAQRLGLSPTTTVIELGSDADVVPISGDVVLGSVPAGPDIALMSRSNAVAAVLASAPGPMDRAAIQEQFVDGGRFDSIDDISLSLSGLKRSGRAEKLGQGLWGLVEEHATASSH